ncbi:MAG: MBL fold metallo-hydrolase [Deltaproteobacteria bacterium]|nr:MBL fold metallo-hydrolase [Deltaproteobacteria bacterium]
MIFDQAGEVAPGFHVLGAREVPSYLLDGERPVVFDAGFTCLGPLYERDLRTILQGRSPHMILLTHVHFDHCGSVSRLKRAFPGVRVAASRRAAEILASDRAVSLIRLLNEQAAVLARSMGARDLDEDPFEPFEVDTVLEDGSIVDLGSGRSLSVIATPGHTRDFLSYHEPRSGLLVASEAAGCADSTGYIFSEFLVDYAAYVDSIERLASLGPELLCQGHFFVYSSADARAFLGRSLEAARQFRAWLEELLEAESGDLEAVAARIKAVEYDPKPGPKQPEMAYMLNLRARVAHIASLA